MRWMELAWAEVGVHEIAGPEAEPAIYHDTAVAAV